MILLIAILAGVAGGWLLARWQQRVWKLPPLHGVWLVIIGFLPQLIAFYLPATRTRIPNSWASIGLVTSQLILLFFCWVNRRLSGIWLMALGLGLNLIVIAANGGSMPMSPQTASRLAPQEAVGSIPLGSRIGNGKDVLLAPAETRFEWLADRFVLSVPSSYQVAFSLGDVILAAGIFWLLLSQGKPIQLKERILSEAECYQPRRTNPPSL